MLQDRIRLGMKRLVRGCVWAALIAMATLLCVAALLLWLLMLPVLILAATVRWAFVDNETWVESVKKLTAAMFS